MGFPRLVGNGREFRYLQPVFFAEIVAMLWLLIVGARQRQQVEPMTP
jgi:hypothetical protein